MVQSQVVCGVSENMIRHTRCNICLRVVPVVNGAWDDHSAFYALEHHIAPSGAECNGHGISVPSANTFLAAKA